MQLFLFFSFVGNDFAERLKNHNNPDAVCILIYFKFFYFWLFLIDSWNTSLIFLLKSFDHFVWENYFKTSYTSFGNEMQKEN